MLILLFLFFISTLLFYIYGVFFISLFENNNNKYSFFDSFFIGFCFIGTILNLWSIFLPTNIISIIFLILFGFYIYYKQKNHLNLTAKNLYRKIKENKLISLLIFFIILIQLLYSVGIPKNYDSYLYHINAIQWNEKFSAVPGLANLHDRFGFNSSQFVLSAAFSFNDIYNQYIFITNSLCFLILIIWILLYSIHKKDLFGIIALLFGYYFFYQYYADFSSPSTDLIPNLLFGYLMLKLIFNANSIYNKGLLYIVLSFFIITFKISLIPIVIVGFISIYFQKQNFTFLIKKTILFGFIFILPWIIRNVILTGYLIYPLASVDVFNFDWEVSKNSVVDIQKWIYSWARIPFKEHNEVLILPFKEWFTIWWENNSLIRNKVIFIISTSAPIFFSLYYFLNKKKVKSNILISFIISYLTFLLWIFTAPDIRFIYACLLILCVYPLLILNKYILHFEKVIKVILFVIGLFFFYNFFSVGYKFFIDEFKDYKKIESYYYLPNDVYYVKYKRKIEFNQLEYETPEGLKIHLFEPKNRHTQCFDKFPCSWYLDNTIKLRGEDLSDGFINVKN
jgi:hypothetical protein